MNKLKPVFFLLLLSLGVNTLSAQIIATTEEGRRALLFSDGHWEWLDKGAQENNSPVQGDLEGEQLVLTKNDAEVGRLSAPKPIFEGGRNYRITIGTAPYLFDGEEDEVYYLLGGKTVVGKTGSQDQARRMAAGHYMESVFRGTWGKIGSNNFQTFSNGEETGNFDFEGPVFEKSGSYGIYIGVAPYLYYTESNELFYMGHSRVGYAVSQEQAVEVAIHHYIQEVGAEITGTIDGGTLRWTDSAGNSKTVSISKPKFRSGRDFEIQVGNEMYMYNDESDEILHRGMNVVGKATSKDMALRVAAWDYLSVRINR